MITNVPSWDDLETISLQLHFSAWAQITKIVREFNQSYAAAELDWHKEWEEYVKAAQTDLQGIYTLIQQSLEIGIKSRISRISPFLLLKKYEAKPVEPNSHQYDFSDFQTIEASELVRIHNMFCADQLSAAFVSEWEKVRKARNKIAHLGLFNLTLDPNELFDLLFLQYRELYPERRWLPDRVLFASKHRWAGAWDEWSPEGEVLHELWDVQTDIEQAHYLTVFGYPYGVRRYICPECGSLLEGLTQGNEPYKADVPTAYRIGAAKIKCAMCLKEHGVEEGKCNGAECDGDLAAVEDEWAGMCLTCGLSAEEIAED